MKFTLNWLRKHISSNHSDLVKKIDEIGLEVEYCEDQRQKYQNFIVAELSSAEQHPNAHSLKVCKVNTGSELLTVVCGAQNARAGIKVVLAKVGATVPNGGFQIKKSKIRGLESEGMLCSAEELCLEASSEGIIELEETAEVGRSFAEHAGLDDVIIAVALTPNRRRDCASVYGIARELAAANYGTLNPIESVTNEGPDSGIVVEIAAKDHCSQFNYFTCRDLNQAALDLRDIDLMRRVKDLNLNPLVNISNFTMLNLGNPNHIYDLDKIAGNTIYVQLSKGGEEFIALGGKQYILPQGLLVICDSEKVLSLAGLMGGELSKVDEKTRNILVEVADFSAQMVALAGQTLGITSDSKYRFEAGIETTSVDRTALWMRRFFKNASAVQSVFGKPYCYVGQLAISLCEIESYIGIPVDDNEIERMLERLSFNPVATGRRCFDLMIPTWKQGNIETYHEVIDDLLRMGLMEQINTTESSSESSRRFISTSQVSHNIIESIKTNSPKGMANSRMIIDSTASQLRQNLIGRGMREVVTWSFYSQEEIFGIESSHIAQYCLNKTSDKNESISVSNPLNNNFTQMRRTIVPNLVNTLCQHPNNKENEMSIFEIGNVYSNLFEDLQAAVVCGLRAGKKQCSFYDVREDLLSLLSLLKLSGKITDYSFDTQVPKYYSPIRSIRVKLGNTVLGICGELHPSLVKKFEIAHKQAAIFEMFVNNIPSKYFKILPAKALTISPYQKINRDLAFIVDSNVTGGDLVASVNSLKEKLIDEVEIFDVYYGLDGGKKSVALNISIQPLESNITDDIINSIMQKVITVIKEKNNGQLRDK